MPSASRPPSASALLSVLNAGQRVGRSGAWVMGSAHRGGNDTRAPAGAAVEMMSPEFSLAIINASKQRN